MTTKTNRWRLTGAVLLVLLVTLSGLWADPGQLLREKNYGSLGVAPEGFSIEQSEPYYSEVYGAIDDIYKRAEKAELPEVIITPESLLTDQLIYQDGMIDAVTLPVNDVDATWQFTVESNRARRGSRMRSPAVSKSQPSFGS